MKPITNLLLFLSILVFAGQAFAFDFSVPKTFGPKDVQLYLRNVSGDKVNQAATGIAYGPMWQMSKNGNWMADLLSVCGVASAQTAGQAQFSGSVGICPFNWWGLQTFIGYDISQSRMTYGIGLSLTGLTNQLMK